MFQVCQETSELQILCKAGQLVYRNGCPSFNGCPPPREICFYWAWTNLLQSMWSRKRSVGASVPTKRVRFHAFPKDEAMIITNYRDCFSRRDHQQEEKSWVTGPRTSTSKFNLINTQYALCIAKFDFVHILGHTSQLLVSLTVDPVQCVLDLEFRVGHGDFMRANF